MRYAQKKRPGAPSRKTLASSTMIVSGLWLLVFLVDSRQGVQVRRRVRMAGAAAAISIAWRWRTSRNPLMVGFYVLSMVVVGSHLWHGVVERVPVARRRPSAMDAAHPDRRQGVRRR